MYANLRCAIFLLALTACAEASAPAKHATESKFLPGSVMLFITRPDSEATCSGVLISATTVATAKHCTQGADRVVVYEPDTARFALAVRIVEDPRQDRAEIETHVAFDAHATLAETLDSRPVRMQGFGCSDKLEQRQGLFYGIERGATRQVVWAGRACLGDSGAGIWNADGRLAAIVTETGFVTDHGRRINILVGELL